MGRRWKQKIGPQDVHGKYGLDADPTLGPSSLADPLVGGELGGGPLGGQGLQGALELGQGREQQVHLLVDGSLAKVAVRADGEQALGFLRREPLGGLGGAYVGQGEDLFA